MRWVFDDEGLRPLIVNWDEVALDMLDHLENQVRHAPTDATAAALLREILALPNVPLRTIERFREASGGGNWTSSAHV